MAGPNIDTSITLSGVSAYTRSIKEVQDHLKNLNSSMRVVTEEFKNNSDSVEGLEKKQKILKAQIEAQNKIVEQGKFALQKFTEENGEFSKSAMDMKDKVNNATTAMLKMQNQLDGVDKKLSEATAKETKHGQEIEKSKTAVTDMEKSLTVYEAQLSAVEKQYGKNSNSVEGMQKKQELFGAAHKQSASIVAELEKQMQLLGKRTDYNSDEFDELQIKLSGAKSKMYDFENSIKESDARLQDCGETAGVFGDILKANIVSDLVMRGLHEATYAIENYVRAGSEGAQELAENQAKLQQIMQNTMGAAEGQSQIIVDLADDYERLGVISAETQIAGSQELATYLTKVDTLKTLMPVMNDMVAQQYGYNAAGDSAVGIATMLGKVMDGQVGALSRYGYGFDAAQEKILKFGTEQERAATLAQVVGDSVGGMNEALGRTDAGKQIRLNAVLDETQKRVGEIYNTLRTELTADMLPAVDEISQKLLSFVEDNKDGIQELAAGLKDGFMFLVDNSETILTFIASAGAGFTAWKVKDTVDAFKQWITEAQGLAAAKNMQAVASAQLAAAETEEIAASAGASVANGAQTIATTANTGANWLNVVSLKALTSAMLASPLFWAAAGGLAITGIKTAVDYLTGSYERQEQRIKELSDEFDALQGELDSTKDKLKDVSSKIDELNKKDKLTIIEQKELDNLAIANKELEIQIKNQTRLLQLQGEEKEKKTVELLDKKVQVSYVQEDPFDGTLGLMNDNATVDERVMMNIKSAELLKQKVDELRQANIALSESEQDYSSQITENESIIIAHGEAIADINKQILEDVDALDKNKESLIGATDAGNLHKANIDNMAIAADRYFNSIEAVNGAQGDLNGNIDETANGMMSASELAEAATIAYTDMNEAVGTLREQYKKGEIDLSTYSAKLSAQMVEATKLAGKNTDLSQSFKVLSKELKKELLDGMKSSTSSLISETDKLSAAFAEQNEEKELSNKTTMSLIDSGYGLALQIDEETGAVTLNKDAYIALEEAKIRARLADIELAKSTISQQLFEESDAAEQAARGHMALANAKYIEAQAGSKDLAELEAEAALLNNLLNNVGKVTQSYTKKSASSKSASKVAKDAADEESKAYKEAVKNLETRSELEKLSAQEMIEGYKQIRDEFAKTEDDKLDMTKKINSLQKDEVKNFGDAATEALQKYYDKRANEETDFFESFKDVQKEQTYLIKESSEERIELTSQEYIEKVRMIDAEKAAVLESCNEQIEAEIRRISLINPALAEEMQKKKAELDSISAEIETREAASRQKQEQERIEKLRNKVNTAETPEDRLEAEKALSDYLEEQSIKMLKENEKNLKAQIEAENKKFQDEVKISKETVKLKQEEQDEIVKIVQKDAEKIKEGYSELYSKLKEQAPEEVAKLFAGGEMEKLNALIMEYNPDWRNAGKGFIEFLEEMQKENEDTDSLSESYDKVNEALTEQAGTVTETVDTMKTEIIEILGSLVDKQYQLAINAGRGYIEGLRAIKPEILAEMASIHSGMIDGSAAQWEINSPARVAIRQARYIGKGYAVGLRDSVADVTAASKELLSNIQLDSKALTSSLSTQQYAGTSNVNHHQYNDSGGNLYLNIDRFENNTDKDIRVLSEEAAFIIRQSNTGRGRRR